MPTNDTTQKIFDFITSYNDKRDEPPNMTEIAAHFKIAKGSVQYHINVLKEAGRIKWFDAKSGWKPL
jgi:DNA-binding MarR family transcriptional regulator